VTIRNWPTRLILLFCFTFFVNATYARGDRNYSLKDVSSRNWDESHVRRVLAAFAYGGLASDAQIDIWSRMRPRRAVAEILTFDSVNNKLSPPEAGDDTSLHCGSLASLQAFWSGDDPGNVMKYGDRSRYAVLNGNDTLSTLNLQRTWVKAISSRGCNPFLHKMALYITNYHASISVDKTRAGLIRDYYDRIAAALSNSGDFIDVMTVAASDAALARAYGHQFSKYNNRTEVFKGTDDFAREFHQLLFRINGTTENTAYHEDTTIEHTAWMLTGMNVDRNQGAYGSVNKADWYIGPIDFSDHYDGYTNPRNLRNTSLHYHSDMDGDSCLEILHSTVCGANAGEKIAELTRIAAEHSESMANVPVTIIDFFADDNLDARKIKAIRGSWVDAEYDLLKFIRKYAASTAFHNAHTFKYRTAFDRNLLVQNMNTLNNEEAFGREFYDSPFARMRDQGALIFDPAHDVFGGQTGFQAANNRYLFKNAYWNNVGASSFLLDINDTYTLEPGVDAQVYEWSKDWGSVIPVNANGEHVVADVAEWLWNRFIGDGGKNFDPIARAQVHALLADNRDFGYVVDSSNPDIAYSSDDIVNGAARAKDQAKAAETMNFETNAANIRVGMAINFITMTPYAFVMESK